MLAKRFEDIALMRTRRTIDSRTITRKRKAAKKRYVVLGFLIGAPHIWPHWGQYQWITNSVAVIGCTAREPHFGQIGGVGTFVVGASGMGGLPDEPEPIIDLLTAILIAIYEVAATGG